MGVRRTWSLPKSDRCEHRWLSSDQSWITGQQHETTTTKGYCKLPDGRSAWNYFTDSLLGSIRSQKCHNIGSDECLEAYSSPAGSHPSDSSLLHLPHTVFSCFFLLSHDKETIQGNKEIMNAPVLKGKSCSGSLSELLWIDDFLCEFFHLMIHNHKTTKATALTAPANV